MKKNSTRWFFKQYLPIFVQIDRFDGEKKSEKCKRRDKNQQHSMLHLKHSTQRKEIILVVILMIESGKIK